MRVKICFEVDIPDNFTLEKESSFEFAPDRVRYTKTVDKACSVVYRKETDESTSIISLQEAAEDYFLAQTRSDDDGFSYHLE